jgi:quercetin dioxygenase-like cupin family protein
MTFKLIQGCLAMGLGTLACAQESSPAPVDGTAIVQHKSEVLKERGLGGRHLWPLLATPEARVNYFEVTNRGSLHYHPDADHRLYVLEGTVLVTCGKAITTCTVGDFIIIPKGVPHCYDVAEKGGRALLLTLDAPPYDPRKTVNLEPRVQAPASK